MPATASNPAHPLSDSLLAQFSDPTLSLLEIATRNRTSLESLALTIARAETSDQLNDIHSLSIARTRYLASLLLSKSLHALTLILDNCAASLGESPGNIQKALTSLEESGDILVKPTGLRHMFRLRTDAGIPDPQRIAEALVQRFGDREIRDIARLNEVLTFASQPGCLTKFLLHRFGEELPQPCGHCGNCRKPRAEPLAIPQSPLPPITGADITALHALHAERHPALRSARALARFLCGITSPAITRTKLNRHDTFGLLTGIPFQQVLDQTESLAGR